MLRYAVSLLWTVSVRLLPREGSEEERDTSRSHQPLRAFGRAHICCTLMTPVWVMTLRPRLAQDLCKEAELGAEPPSASRSSATCLRTARQPGVAPGKEGCV